MPAHRPILVTGAHRSGTGWVGSMLAASADPPVAYLWEPFSLLHRPGTLAARFDLWYPYVSGQNGGPLLGPIRDMLAFRYRPAAEIPAIRSPKDVGRMLRDWTRFARYRSVRARPLLKDPIALFSATWLCDTFDMDVIVLIRHPAAFANSIVRRGLSHPFDHFLRQPLLMRDVLADWREPIEELSAREHPLIDQAILLWNLTHSAIARYQRSRPDWTFVRLEDIAADPEAAFETMYERLGLRFDERVRGSVREHSDRSNPTEAADPASHKRDSRTSVVAWRSRLTSEQIDRIRAGTAEVAPAFYSARDW